MKIKIWGLALALFLASIFLVLPSSSGADVLLWDKFDKRNLDTAVWAPSDPVSVYVEDEVLVLDQKASGKDGVNVNTKQIFPDCVIYYQWTFAEYSGQGDCGGYLRQDPGGAGGYIMRWGWGNTVNLADSVDHAPVAKWTAFPGCKSPYPATSTHFDLRASLITPIIKVQINDLDTGNRIADWEYEDDWYDDGKLHFSCWKFGVVHVDNVVVATTDWEEAIFSDGFDPETLETKIAVTSPGKLVTTWSEIKSQ